ncbi:MAG: helix-turn-helix domain-containing protein [Oscillospiraceae bacterium]|nr:helix-turn-helix domain-containing protein [Oscillospiraceae bacterium]
MAIGDRILLHRNRCRMTREELAKRLNTTPQNIYKYEKGIITNIPLSKIERMAEIFDIPPERLTGWGNPNYKDEYIPPQEDYREIDRLYDALNEAGQAELCSYGRYLGTVEIYRPAEPRPARKAPARIIPLLGQSFAAGAPEAPGDLLFRDYETTDPRAEFAIHVNGDSMEPYLHDGTVALGVKRFPRDGEVGAFFLDGGFLVKQFCSDMAGNVYLFALNRSRADADDTVWHDSGRDLRCVGTILMSRRIPLP